MRACILKPVQGVRLYRRMLAWYGARELKRAVEEALADRPEGAAAGVAERIRQEVRPAFREWVNLGGQLLPEPTLRRLAGEVEAGRLAGWEELHREYDTAWAEYPRQRRDHALHCLLAVKGLALEQLTDAAVAAILAESAATARELQALALESRAKDYTNPFRRAVYRSQAEMDAVLGRLEDNPFLVEFRRRSETYAAEAEGLARRLGGRGGGGRGGGRGRRGGMLRQEVARPGAVADRRAALTRRSSARSP